MSTGLPSPRPHRPGLAFRLWRHLIFWVGDVRRIRHFPFVTWDVHQHRIDLNEVIQEALPVLQPGDVLLHRDEGYLSNLGIGGVMIHAGLYVGHGQVVEAISEGVVMRHAAHLLYSDYACALRPSIGLDALFEAIKWAGRIIGYPYDVLFRFTGSADRGLVAEGRGYAQARGVAFACTEVPYFAYARHAETLRLYRRRNVSLTMRAVSLLGLRPGEAVIDADMYWTAAFEPVWVSRAYTPQWARKMGAGEEHLLKLTRYWDGRPPRRRVA